MRIHKSRGRLQSHVESESGFILFWHLFATYYSSHRVQFFFTIFAKKRQTEENSLREVSKNFTESFMFCGDALRRTFHRNTPPVATS